MDDDAGWWIRNSAQLQVLTTVALSLITAAYVVLTNRIAKSAAEQAKAAAEQAKSAAEQATAATEQATASNRQAEAANRQSEVAREQLNESHNVLVESVRARLSSETPLATVVFNGSPMRSPNDGSLGNISLEEFERSRVQVTVKFIVRNDGKSPTLVTALPSEVPDSELLEPADWVRTTRDRVLMPGGEPEHLVFRMIGAGEVFRRWGDEHRRVTFEFETKSPLTGVTDRHSWVGTFPEIQVLRTGDGTIFDHNMNSGFFGADVAYPMRLWPPGV